MEGVGGEWAQTLKRLQAENAQLRREHHKQQRALSSGPHLRNNRAEPASGFKTGPGSVKASIGHWAADFDWSLQGERLNWQSWGEGELDDPHQSRETVSVKRRRRKGKGATTKRRPRKSAIVRLRARPGARGAAERFVAVSVREDHRQLTEAEAEKQQSVVAAAAQKAAASAGAGGGFTERRRPRSAIAALRSHGRSSKSPSRSRPSAVWAARAETQMVIARVLCPGGGENTRAAMLLIEHGAVRGEDGGDGEGDINATNGDGVIRTFRMTTAHAKAAAFAAKEQAGLLQENDQARPIRFVSNDWAVLNRMGHGTVLPAREFAAMGIAPADVDNDGMPVLPEAIVLFDGSNGEEKNGTRAQHGGGLSYLTTTLEDEEVRPRPQSASADSLRRRRRLRQRHRSQAIKTRTDILVPASRSSFGMQALSEFRSGSSAGFGSSTRRQWRRMMLGDSERADTAGPGPATIAHIPTDRTRVLSGRPRPSTSSGAVSRTAARNGKGDYIRARYRSGPDDILARHTEGKQGMSSPCLTPDLSQATSAVAFAMNERASIPKSGNRRMSRIEASGIKKSREALAKDRQGKRVLRFLAQQQQTPSGDSNNASNEGQQNEEKKALTQEEEDALDVMQSKAALALISHGIKSLELGFGWGD